MDERGHAACEGAADGGFQILRRPRAEARDTEGVGELQEVRVVEFGGNDPVAIALLLDALDVAEHAVVEQHHHDRQAMLHGGRQLAERLSRLEPQVSFLKAIRAALPEDGIFVDEVSQVGFASRVALPIEKPRTFLSPGYQDNLGWGFGTALGAKAAMPDRKVLAIAGDGGFLYQIGELATAARHNIAVMVVVFDNGAFGNVKRIQQERYGNRLIASDLQNPDFAKLADSFGIASFKAIDAKQLEDALHKAFALNAPALVWVPHGDVPSPWDLIMMPRVR